MGGGLAQQPAEFAENVKNWQAARKEMHDRSTRYAQVVFGIGYAGFFALWAGTRQQLQPWEVVLSAALVTASLLGYLGFEVLVIRAYGSMMMKATKVITDDWNQYYETVQIYLNEEQQLLNSLGKLSAPVFWFTFVTGFGGGLVLLVAFAKRLWAIAR